MGIVVVPSFGSDPVTVTATNLDAKVDGLATEFNGNIENANIKSTAAIAYSKLNLTGAIQGTDLATITTAGKVSGAALTLLPNTPSAAGILPNINNIGGAIEIVFDNAGTEIEDNSHLEVLVPQAITITGAYMFADVSGSIIVDVWKDTIANYPPTAADKITASAPPTITTATNSTDTTLTGWTTAVAALSVLKFNVTSCTTITKCTVVLTFTRA
jgi:hypothetical protein